MSKALLIIFIKNPVLGSVKTRLALTIGSEKALAIYYQLLEHTQQITQVLPFDKALYYSDFLPKEDKWNNSVYKKLLQSEGDLGERMRQAFEYGFANQYSRICIIGSDCFELTSEIIMQAFQKLEEHDVVIGPATDGGYYLIGSNKPHYYLFRNKSWSTESVLSETLRDIKENNLSVILLPTLTDVDEEKDLITMHKD